MKSDIKIWLIICLIAFSLMAGLMVFSCGDDDDDDDAADDDDSTDDDDDAADDDSADDDDVIDDDDVVDDDDDDSGIAVQIVNFNPTTPIVGATCELLENTNGSPLDPPVTVTSDDEGWCTFTNPAKVNRFAVKVTHMNYLDNYFFNLDDIITWELYMFNEDQRNTMAGAMSVTVDTGKAFIVGRTQYFDEEDAESAPSTVGCATVTLDSGATVNYIGIGGLPDMTRTTTYPGLAWFIAANADTVATVATSDVEGKVETGAMPKVPANSVVYVNVFYLLADYMNNPTPDGCSK